MLPIDSPLTLCNANLFSPFLFSVGFVCFVVYFLAWPRAKMLATNVNTSVALSSL